MTDSEADPPAPSAAPPEFADAAHQVPSLELEVAQARAAEALFGASEAVKIGRYRIIERIGAGGMGVVWSAWDPVIERTVAVKLAATARDAARDRVREEGRALGRVSHPNVVPIYDVIDHDDRVYLVMELIKGQTLRAAGRQRSPQQIIRDYRQAGDGLAAAHHAGLIHRDFKPDNAVLGADGRVRVLDFGLAQAIDGDDSRRAGTPRYMAPEQVAGGPLSPAIDQYALAVAIREALDTRGGVPRWLAPILARAQAPRPEERFPTMDALVSALGRDPASRRRRGAAIVGLALAGAVIVAAVAIDRSHGLVEAPCSGVSSSLAAVWGAARRGAVSDRLAKLDGPYSTTAAPRLIAAIDRYADAWLAVRLAGCEAHVRREVSDAFYDRQLSCLARPRAALARAVDLAERADARSLAGLIEATAQLPDVAACSDDDGVDDTIAPPAVADRAEVERIAGQLVEVDVSRDAGSIGDAQAGADRAVTAASRLGYGPLVARAFLARGRIALEAGVGDAGAADFARAHGTAVASGDFVTAVEAYARRAYALLLSEDEPRRIRAGIDGLSTMIDVTRWLGTRGEFAAALLFNNLGAVARSHGAVPQARLAYQRALDLAAQVSGAGALELTIIQLNLMQLSDTAEQRLVYGESALATLRERLGPDHPRVLQAGCMIAMASADVDRASAELAALVERYRRLHPRLVEPAAACADALIWTSAIVGDRGRVVAAAEAIALRATAGPLLEPYRLLADGQVGAARASFAAALHGSPRYLAKVDLQIGAILAAAADRDAGAAAARLAELDALLAGLDRSVSASAAALRRSAAAVLRRDLGAAQ